MPSADLKLFALSVCFSVVRRCRNAWLTRNPRGSAGGQQGQRQHMRHKERCLVARNENTAPTSNTTLCSLYKIHICTTYSLCPLRSFESEIRFRGKKLLCFLIVGLLRFHNLDPLPRRYELSTTQAKSLLQTTIAFFAVELHESPHSVLTLRTPASSNHIFCCGAVQITFLKTHPQFHHPSRLRYQGRHLPPTTFQLRPRDILLPMRPPRLKFL